MMVYCCQARAERLFPDVEANRPVLAGELATQGEKSLETHGHHVERLQYMHVQYIYTCRIRCI